MTIKYFIPQPHTLSEGKALYKKLCMENHPDLGGSVEAMQAINTEWDYLKSRLPRFDTGIHTDYSANAAREKAAREKAETIKADLRPMAAKLTEMGIAFDIVGNWIWSDDRRAADAGMHYSKGRNKWYWRPDNAESKSSRSHKSYDWIYAKYNGFNGQKSRQETITA